MFFCTAVNTDIGCRGVTACINNLNIVEKLDQSCLRFIFSSVGKSFFAFGAYFRMSIAECPVNFKTFGVFEKCRNRIAF